MTVGWLVKTQMRVPTCSNMQDELHANLIHRFIRGLDPQCWVGDEYNFESK